MNMRWAELNIHPFSINYMYEYTGEGRTDRQRTKSYNEWRERFFNLPIPSIVDIQFWCDIDFNKPLVLEIEFVSKEWFDTDDIVKSFQDCLFEYYDRDDVIVKRVIATQRGIVDSYSKGKMRFRLSNLDYSKLEKWECEGINN